MLRIRIILVLLSAIVVTLQTTAQSSDDTDNLTLPEGFEITVFAQVDEARHMTLGDEGTIFIGTRVNSQVYAIRDTDGDYIADEQYIIDGDLLLPNGVLFHEGDLYVATVTELLRYDDIENHLDNPPEPVVITTFPDEAWHGHRTIGRSPDNKLVISIGSPCNVCETQDPFGTLAQLDFDGSNFEILARGIRFSVGFDWHPETGDLWFTDNGRDELGDDLPPDELNHLSEIGQNFGFPYCHGGFVIDDTFGNDGDCNDYTAPAQNLGAHVAPLGMIFYTGDMFPEEYVNQVFIAEHGSWNRTPPSGYRVTLVRFDEDGNALSYEPFITGWLDDETAVFSGRPVGLLQLEDGSLLISTDAGSTIYRVTYSGDS